MRRRNEANLKTRGLEEAEKNNRCVMTSEAGGIRPPASSLLLHLGGQLKVSGDTRAARGAGPQLAVTSDLVIPAPATTAHLLPWKQTVAEA